ncbi:MAG: glutathione S-transferase N-terminal domain-containing protein [Gammaproteobacteria bacterium]|uniref:glutathione S-transferase N-terminal domain-containing protein n=1 Tax=Thalassobaculum sp. TaxID=2022740 RepID=UPI0032EC1556
MMRLLSAAPSPYARKVRIALAEKGLPFELVTEVPWNADTTTSLYNPLEKLPVLILEDGETVYESRFILEWLEVKHPEPPLLSADPDQRLAARRLEVLVDGMLDAFLLHFWERRRPEAYRSTPWMARQMRKIEGGMRELDRLVPATGFCVGNRFGLGDIVVGTALDYLQLRFPEYPWQNAYPKLVDVLQRLSERESFRTTVPVSQQIEAAAI